PKLDVQLITTSLGLLYGSHDVILTTPLLILRSEVLLWRTGLDVGDKGRQKWDRLAAHRQLIDILGVRWLTSVHDVDIPGIRKVGVFADGAVHLYENPTARPPAWLAGCAQVARPQAVDADPITFLDALDPDRPLVEVEDGELPVPACQSSGVSPGTVKLVEDGPQRMVFDVHATAPALMVQNDTWYPGWVATVDGQPVPLYRTLFAFRGLPVPKGDHQVVLAYDPGRLGTLLLLTPACLLLLVLWGAMSGMGRRRPSALGSGPA
ncbi:MAG: YfhO family protein, partial [Oligoflexia bacterium]|nr:YfhO family protein [Oligoflexia bacterium]